MFLSDFCKADKNTFLRLAKRMVAIDNVLAPEELEMLEDVACEMELDADVELPERNLEELCAAVTSTQTHALMLLELASIARVDNKYADEERELFRTIASLWKTDQITTIRIEAWAERRIQLSREAAEIVREITCPLGQSS